MSMASPNDEFQSNSGTKYTLGNFIPFLVDKLLDLIPKVSLGLIVLSITCFAIVHVFSDTFDKYFHEIPIPWTSNPTTGSVIILFGLGLLTFGLFTIARHYFGQYSFQRPLLFVWIKYLFEVTVLRFKRKVKIPQITSLNDKNSSIVLELDSYVTNVSFKFKNNNLDQTYWRCGLRLSYSDGSKFVFHLYEDDGGREAGKIKWLVGSEAGLEQFGILPNLQHGTEYKLKTTIQYMNDTVKMTCFVNEQEVYSVVTPEVQIQLATISAWTDSETRPINFTISDIKIEK